MRVEQFAAGMYVGPRRRRRLARRNRSVRLALVLVANDRSQTSVRASIQVASA